jgi:hypothetical protein
MVGVEENVADAPGVASRVRGSVRPRQDEGRVDAFECGEVLNTGFTGSAGELNLLFRDLWKPVFSWRTGVPPVRTGRMPVLHAVL